MTSHQFADEGSLTKYFAAIPNIVFELGLSPFELTLYSYIKRAAGARSDGKCTKSGATLARETGMGTGTVSRAKLELERKRSEIGNRPLIRIKEIPNPKGGKLLQEITVTDIWKANMARFATSTVEIEAENQLPVEGGSTSRATSRVEIKKNTKKNKEKKVCAPAQDKAETPSGIQLLRDVAKAYPPKESWDRYLAILGDEPDEAKLRKCRAEWADRGYNKMSWKWLTDWYANGLPDAQRNGNGNGKSKTLEWQGVAYAVGDVISDDGKRYTIMGEDGTPTNRWHSTDVFLQDRKAS